MEKQNAYRTITLLILFSSSVSFAQTNSKPNLLKKEIRQSTYAIKNVNIIPMTEDGVVIKKATLVIKNDKIESINGTIPKEAKIIDGTGKFLMPGLIDMHVHVTTDGGPFGPKLPTQGATTFFDLQDFMTLHNSNGVTTVFDLGSRPEHFAQRNEIGKGAVIGSITLKKAAKRFAVQKQKAMNLSNCIPTSIQKLSKQ